MFCRVLIELVYVLFMLMTKNENEMLGLNGNSYFCEEHKKLEKEHKKLEKIAF